MSFTLPSHNWIPPRLVEVFIASHKTPPKQLVLNFDATHDPVHGQQIDRSFRGYYDGWGFLYDGWCFLREERSDLPHVQGLKKQFQNQKFALWVPLAASCQC